MNRSYLNKCLLIAYTILPNSRNKIVVSGATNQRLYCHSKSAKFNLAIQGSRLMEDSGITRYKGE